MSDELLEEPAPSPADGAITGLRGEKIIKPDADELIDAVARDMLRVCFKRTIQAGVAHLALSGGSTPQALYQRLMIDPIYRLFPWSNTHLWIVDDRCVPFTDAKSNYKMIRDLIVGHCDIPAANVHPMEVLEPDGDKKYESELRTLLGTEKSQHRLDYVLLGMGGDAHTASLFPRTPALDERERWVVFNDGESVAAPRPRMTMTYPLINSARRIAVLVTGENKHAALRQVADAMDTGSPDVKQFPVAGIVPAHGDIEMAWFLDAAAAQGNPSHGLPRA